MEPMPFLYIYAGANLFISSGANAIYVSSGANTILCTVLTLVLMPFGSGANAIYFISGANAAYLHRS